MSGIHFGILVVSDTIISIYSNKMGEA